MGRQQDWTKELQKNNIFCSREQEGWEKMWEKMWEKIWEEG